MDGEKDPRNLIVCFRNAALLINQLNIGVLAEDLFEVDFPSEGLGRIAGPTSKCYQICQSDFLLQQKNLTISISTKLHKFDSVTKIQLKNLKFNYFSGEKMDQSNDPIFLVSLPNNIV